MIEKLKGEALSQEHKQGEKSSLDFKEATRSILDEGRISIEKSVTEKYPDEAREMLNDITEEDVKKAIAEQSDFSKSTTWYVEGLNEEGRPTSMSGGKTKRSLGVTRAVYLIIKEDSSKNIKICANADLMHLDGQKPKIKVYLYASKINFDFDRAPNDGRCLSCEGWGCWQCGFSGGY